MPVKIGQKFARNYAYQKVLTPHLDAWFARGVFPDDLPILIHPNKEKDAAYHPSSATKCARVLYAERLGLLDDEKISVESAKNFMFGHYVHGLVYYVVQDLGFAIEEDIEWEFNGLEPVWTRGFVDVRKCVIPGHDDPYLVDIKSQRAMAFAMDPTAGLLEKYTTQVQIYLYFSGMPRAIILWAEKDSPHRFKETIIQPDDAYVESVLERWANVDAALKAGSPPECTCGKVLDCPAFKMFLTD